MDLYGLVGDFHRRLNLGHRHGLAAPKLLDDDTVKARLTHMGEELIEYALAHGRGDLAGTQDALCDLVWLALGTAQLQQSPFDACFAEVARSNAGRVRDPVNGKPHKMFVVKGPDWTPPDIAGVLRKWSVL